MKNIKSKLNFGGFYHSLHSIYIDSMVENYEEKGDEFENYQDLYIEYSKDYVDFFNELVGCNIHFHSLYSPKYYNFETDRIYINASNEDLLILIKYIKDNDLKDAFYKICKDVKTSVNGYVAFYNYKDVFIKENRWLLFEILADVVINESDEEFDSFYDLNFMYELIYNI